MDMQPKTGLGSAPPVFTSNSSNHANLDDMSVPQLVSRMRTALHRRDEFDSLEKVLVAKDAKLKAEVTSIQVKFEVERLKKLQADEEMKKKEEECEKGKKAKELYQKLLKESELVNMETIKELREKNNGSLDENCKLKELITKLVDDSIALAKLRVRVSELEDERVEFEARKKNWEDAMLLKSVGDASGSGENAERAEPKAVYQELREFNEMDVGDMNGSAGASAFGTNNTIIDIIKDSDDNQTRPRQEKNNSREQTIDIAKRK